MCEERRKEGRERACLRDSPCPCPCCHPPPTVALPAGITPSLMLGRQDTAQVQQCTEALLDEADFGETNRTGGFSLPKLRLRVGGDALQIPSYLSPSPQCLLCPGSPRLPLLPAAGREAAPIIHLNVSIKQGYDQDETRNKVF